MEESGLGFGVISVDDRINRGPSIVEERALERPRRRGECREQDRFLPIANIGQIMRKGIPENGKIAKDAKESVQESVSEFIRFITSKWKMGSSFALDSRIKQKNEKTSVKL